MFPFNCSNQTKVEGKKEGSEAPKGTFSCWPLSSGGCTVDVVVKGGHDSPASRRVNYGAFVRVEDAYRRICFFFFLMKAEV